jgi:hypothetical protein
MHLEKRMDKSGRGLLSGNTSVCLKALEKTNFLLSPVHNSRQNMLLDNFNWYCDITFHACIKQHMKAVL